MSILNDKEIPIGFGMALAQNLDAMQAFAAMDGPRRSEVIARSRQASSKEDMTALVDELLK